MRYIRAFFKALVLTLRGQRVPAPLPPGAFTDWVRSAQPLLATVYEAAEADPVDPGQVTVTIDRRTMTMKVILDTVHHHLHAEYPYILRHPTQNHLATIQAINLNDHYWITRLAQAPALGDSSRSQLERLAAHLEAVPSVKSE